MENKCPFSAANLALEFEKEKVLFGGGSWK